MITTDIYRGFHVYFIGVGDTGERIGIELNGIYEGIRDGLFYEEHDVRENHLQILSYSCSESFSFDEEFQLVILAGSFNDVTLRDMRQLFHDRQTYLTLTIATDYQTCASQPFPNECLLIPEQSLSDSVAIAKLVLQIFLIHTLWDESDRGSMVGYDLTDTKNMLAGKTAKVVTLTIDQKHRRHNFSSFLDGNSELIKRTQGILMTFWGISLREMNELSSEMMKLLTPDTCEKMHEMSAEEIALLMPDIDVALTFHDLPDDETCMATFFMLI